MPSEPSFSPLLLLSLFLPLLKQVTSSWCPPRLQALLLHLLPDCSRQSPRAKADWTAWSHDHFWPKNVARGRRHALAGLGCVSTPRVGSTQPSPSQTDDTPEGIMAVRESGTCFQAGRKAITQHASWVPCELTTQRGSHMMVAFIGQCWCLFLLTYYSYELNYLREALA